MIRGVTTDAFPCFFGPIFLVIDGMNDAEECAFSAPIIPILRKGSKCQFGTGFGGPLADFRKRRFPITRLFVVVK